MWFKNVLKLTCIFKHVSNDMDFCSSHILDIRQSQTPFLLCFDSIKRIHKKVGECKFEDLFLYIINWFLISIGNALTALVIKYYCWLVTLSSKSYFVGFLICAYIYIIEMQLFKYFKHLVLKVLWRKVLIFFCCNCPLLDLV